MSGSPSRPSLFSRTLRECRKLYVSSGELVVREHRELLADDQQDYVRLMDDLHRALVLKIYVTICEADRKWSKQERFLAEVLCHHLFNQWMTGDELRETIKYASSEAAELRWYSMVRPFDRVAPLRERIGQLETLVNRLSNLIARCDGDLNDAERKALISIEEEITSHLRTAPIDQEEDQQVIESVGKQAIEESRSDVGDLWPAAKPPRSARGSKSRRPTAASSRQPTKDKDRRKPTDQPVTTVEEALAELDSLIGLSGIKHEVRSLANFLTLQRRRDEAGLPTTDIALHMVFTGNPGTGKTTVARIVGKVFRALGVLDKGHLIETDRSGLVAEYAGQTGPKTNKRIDDAMDGLLFIDEAYSLVATNSEDPYGREAVQALLKRAEDDRQRLVVILAGYPSEMQTLLESNPGLSSRFNRTLEFVDYKPLELAQIFGLMCRQNRYELTAAARLKILLGLEWEYRRRDRHYGNGRAVRNLFEQAVRRMANRLAEDADITQEELVTLEAADIDFSRVTADAFAAVDESQLRLTLACPKCDHANVAPTSFLGKPVKCPKCDARFTADWGELAVPAPS
ncbi:MAG: AAA family ATPase [Planctomycetota bacterium]